MLALLTHKISEIMIFSSTGRCAIVLYFAINVAFTSAASFRGAAAGGDATDVDGINDQPHRSHHHRILQEDPCAGKKNNVCPKDGPNPECDWLGGNCVPAGVPPTQSPVTPGPTSAPTKGPTKSPVPAGMGYCSDDDTTPCWSVSACNCAGTATAQGSNGETLFDRRRLQDCASAANRGACVKIDGCGWVGDGCVSSTPGPTTSPVVSSPKVSLQRFIHRCICYL